MTLIDALISSAISAVVFASLASAILVLMRTAPQVQSDVAEAQDVRQVVRYLPSDVGSTPASPGAFSTDPAALSGCFGGQGNEGQNILRLASSEIVSGMAVAISYRVVPQLDGPSILQRVRCEGPDEASLGPPEITSIADELDPGIPVEVTIVDDGVTVSRVTVALIGASGQRSTIAGSPMMIAAGLPPASTTTTTTTTTTTIAATTTTVAAPTTSAAGPTTTAAATTTVAGPTTTTAATTTTTALPVCSTNPFRNTGGFAGFVAGGNLELRAGDSYGPIATAGDLAFTDYFITPRSTTLGFTASGESMITGLLVGGEIDWASSGFGQLTVKDTPVHVGNFSNGSRGLTLLNETNLLQWPGINLLKMVKVTGIRQALSGTLGIERPGLIDFVAAKAALQTASASLATLPGTCAGASSLATFGVNGIGPWSGTGPVWLSYAANKVNVFNSNVSQLQGMTNVNMMASSTPASTTTLVLINVTDSGAVSFTPPTWTQNEPRSVIWNFPNATQITLNGPLWGSLLAPQAKVIANGDLRGNVISNALTINGGSLDWDRRFAGQFPWDPWVQP